MNQKEQDLSMENDDVLMFMEEEDIETKEDNNRWKILVVDDEKAIHAVTNIVLKTFSLDDKETTIFNAYNVAEAKEVLNSHKDIALVLLDVVMETDCAGFDLIKYIRNDLKNNDTRIVIRTGQPGIAPEFQVMKEYDINNYKDKTELTNTKLFTTVYSAIKAYRDIQNLKNLQKELKRKEALLNKAEKLSRMGSWEWDIGNDEVYCSDEAYKILELSRENKQNSRALLKHVHPDDISLRINTVKKAIETKEPYSLEYRFVLDSGRVLYIDERGEVLSDESGKPIKLLGVSRDVTKKKEAQKIKEENEHIQLKLYAQELKDHEQKKISDAKDAFLVLFTHELKTPLNAIINFTKYLLKHVSAETINDIPLSKREKLLKQIDLSAAKMLDDVTKILELSKMKSNKLEYKITSCNVFDVLNEVIENHSALCEENNVVLSFEPCCKELYVQSDAYRLGQIFANILSNAIKYSNGIIHIKIECICDKYHIIIEDNGDGIEDKEKAFGLFEQMDSNITTRNTKGTGIGLSFVKHLCLDLNINYIMEDSKELGGLRFSIFINQKSR